MKKLTYEQLETLCRSLDERHMKNQKEFEKLRAELAAERKAHHKQCELTARTMTRVADLQGELAAMTSERDEWIGKCRTAVWADSEELKDTAAERDELRELLGKADVQLRVLRYEGDLLASIDAALGESSEKTKDH